MASSEPSVVVEHLVPAHARPHFAEDVLDSEPGSLEHGLAQHHVFAFLNVILPPEGHGAFPVREFLVPLSPCLIRPRRSETLSTSSKKSLVPPRAVTPEPGEPGKSSASRGEFPETRNNRAPRVHYPTTTGRSEGQGWD